MVTQAKDHSDFNIDTLAFRKTRNENPLTQDIQWCQIENQQSPVYDMKWGHFDREKSTFKMLLSSQIFYTVFRKVRYFDAENLSSVDLRAAKLQAVKVGDLKLFCWQTRFDTWTMGSSSKFEGPKIRSPLN